MHYKGSGRLDFMCPMAAEPEESLPTAAQTQSDTHILNPSSPSLSQSEFFGAESSISRTPSQRQPAVESSLVRILSLSENPDYLALQSALNLLNAQHRQAVEDMQKLHTLKNKAIADPVWFKQLVEAGQLSDMVPRKQQIVRCPKVDWERYGGLGSRLGRELEKPTLAEAVLTVSSFCST
jgi:hypothetical protein